MYAKYAVLRDEKKLTDYKVAQDVGIAPSTLSDWKNGLYTPKADKLLKLAEYFNVSIEYFLKD
ncbi:MAG: helix-turn-helix transcriptional regulator [Clostridia bacterium]|nr:helix-turn-helix transcriptional regulator [Clostridia bacterium]